ncbi:DUF983 domain-containing protein [Paracoccus nototheniae]|uniref:DUF983 domain-containing protein n=1 Tax=Paracoccus nototheniae TaxID=2489002 RepID=A0ABW4DT72_9RHOB|nr:DUF983 domain-containing protein [Paracoccus nototheniae]
MTQTPPDDDHPAPRASLTAIPDDQTRGHPPPDSPARDTRQAVLRGLANRCPNCGEGQLLQGFLTLNAECAQCETPLGRYPAADGPAFFTMTVMLLVMIPLFGIVWNVWRPEPLTLLAVTGAIMTVMTLVLLRLIKGAFIGYLWASDEQDRGA